MIKDNNKYIPCTKKEFVEIIGEIKKYHKKIDNIQIALEENCEEALLFPPSLETTLVNTLELAFNDTDDMIGYFIYELEFGKKWTEGTVLDKDGNDIKMQTTGDLYDYLIETLEIVED